MLWGLITLHLLSLSPSLPLLIISSLSPSLIIFKSYHRHHPPHHHHRSSSYSLTTPFLVSTEERTVSLLVLSWQKSWQVSWLPGPHQWGWQERKGRRDDEEWKRDRGEEMMWKCLCKWWCSVMGHTYLLQQSVFIIHFCSFLKQKSFLSRWEVYYQNKMNAVVCYVIVHCKTKLLWLMNG